MYRLAQIKEDQKLRVCSEEKMSWMYFYFLVEFFSEISRNHFSVLVCNVFKNDAFTGKSQLFCLYLKNMNYEYVASHVKDQNNITERGEIF